MTHHPFLEFMPDPTTAYSRPIKTVDAETRALIDAALKKKKPTICPPCTFAAGVDGFNGQRFFGKQAIPHARKEITEPAIKRICNRFGVDRLTLMGDSLTGNVTKARQELYIDLKRGGLTEAQIAKFMGRKKTQIDSAIKTYYKELGNAKA